MARQAEPDATTALAQIRDLTDRGYTLTHHPLTPSGYGVTVADLGAKVAEVVDQPSPAAAIAAVYERVTR